MIIELKINLGVLPVNLKGETPSVDKKYASKLPLITTIAFPDNPMSHNEYEITFWLVLSPFSLADWRFMY